MCTIKMWMRFGVILAALLAVIAVGCAKKQVNSTPETKEAEAPAGQDVKPMDFPEEDSESPILVPEGDELDKAEKAEKTTEAEKAKAAEPADPLMPKSVLAKEDQDEMKSTSNKVFFSAIEEPPSYEMFERSLEYIEQQKGIKFRRNDNKRFYLFSSQAWNHFAIADVENHCLYDVEYDRMRSFQHLGTGYRMLLDMKVEQGPCGITSDNVSSPALDLLQHMEGAVISKKLLENIEKGTNFISDQAFLQETMQVPWKVESSYYGLEPFLALNAQRVEDSLDIAFGDIVFFSEYVNETTVGIYIGYGLVVTNCCFRTEVHRMNNEQEYRIYRLYSGFGQVEYKVHQDSVLHTFLTNPR